MKRKFLLLRLWEALLRDEADAKYWSGIFSMTGAACLAIAFIEANVIALYIGGTCCLYGLKFNRKGGGRC